MAEQFFMGSHVLVFPVLALIAFLVVFGAVTWMAVRADAAHMNALARMPLESDRSRATAPASRWSDDRGAERDE